VRCETLSDRVLERYFLALILNIQFLRTSCSQAGPTTSLAMSRYLAMPVAQNASIGVGAGLALGFDAA
jgi:hypothetical protein